MTPRLVCLLAALVLCSLGLSGADLSGIWTGQMVDRNGDLQDVSFRFTQVNDQLTGKMYGDNESTPIAEGKVSGAEITFLVVGELNGQITRSLYKGTVVGEEIHVIRGRQAEKAPDKPEPKADVKSEAKPAPKQTFVLKRLT